MRTLILISIILLINTSTARAENPADDLRRLYEEFEQNEGVSLTELKIRLDQIIDPTIDAVATEKQLIDMTARIMAMAGGRRDEARVLAALQAYIYQPGPWNNNHAFSYDMDDPLGHKLSNKLIHSYLETRKGNCVSMPILVLLLGEKLGLEMTLAHAPYHLFIKYRPSGSDQWINLETTSGARPARDEWIRQNGPMTDKALSNGVYMQPLDKQRLFAALATTILEHAMAEKRYDDVIAISDILLEIDDKNISVIISRASAFGRKMDIEFHKRYPNIEDVPISLHSTYRAYSENNLSGFRYAEDLGWIPDDKPQQ